MTTEKASILGALGAPRTTAAAVAETTGKTDFHSADAPIEIDETTLTAGLDMTAVNEFIAGKRTSSLKNPSEAFERERADALLQIYTIFEHYKVSLGKDRLLDMPPVDGNGTIFFSFNKTHIYTLYEQLREGMHAMMKGARPVDLFKKAPSEHPSVNDRDPAKAAIADVLTLLINADDSAVAVPSLAHYVRKNGAEQIGKLQKKMGGRTITHLSKLAYAFEAGGLQGGLATIDTLRPAPPPPVKKKEQKDPEPS